MAPDWEKLAEEWDGSEVGLIAEIDCTAAGKPLCEENGVRGFPTLKYGDPAALDDYQAPRSYEDMAAFAKEHLKPICTVKNMDLCDDEKKQQIAKYMDMNDDDLAKEIAKEEKKLEELEEDFKKAVARLQAEYQKLSEEKDEAISKVKHSGVGLMRSVLSAKMKGKGEKAATKDEL